MKDMRQTVLAPKNNERQLIWAKYVLKMCSMQLEIGQKIYGPTQFRWLEWEMYKCRDGKMRRGWVIVWNSKIEINAGIKREGTSCGISIFIA